MPYLSKMKINISFLLLLIYILRDVSSFRAFHSKREIKTINRNQKSFSIDNLAEKSLTESIMEKIPEETQAGGAGGVSTFEALKRIDKTWLSIRNMKEGFFAGPAPSIVKEEKNIIEYGIEYDVIVCGGTIGIFMATALQLKGWKVCVVERGNLVGRQQDWNISEQELDDVINEGVFGKDEKEDIISIKFNPMRAGFKRYEGDPNGVDALCPDVLNLGVRPSIMVSKARKRFEAAGGKVLEHLSIDGISVHPNGTNVFLSNGSYISSRLVLDCMGNSSPLVKEIRWGKKPDGICLVVGCCASGFKAETNTSGDVIYANSPIFEHSESVDSQYFWEAFPASPGPSDRTIYMFQYMDADPNRPSLHEMMEDFWKLMPAYQNITLDELNMRRVMFGMFPTYKDSPLQTKWDRICQIGDAAALQSPLSFGGFASLSRHISRLTRAFDESLKEDMLDRDSLRLINAYQPNLSCTWMFQKSMSVEVGKTIDPYLIVDLMANNFKVMEAYGVGVLKPFLKDVIQFFPLIKILSGVTIADPKMLPPLVDHVGLTPTIEWTGHFIQMGLYTFAHKILSRILVPLMPYMSKEGQFKMRRQLEVWEYGSGLDYKPREETGMR